MTDLRKEASELDRQASELRAEAMRLRRLASEEEERQFGVRLRANEDIPVDRSARTLTDGSAVTEDHRQIDTSTGMQRGYVVLSAEERAKGFVRPVRRSYVHEKCGVTTTMGQALAETYARDPSFYSGTFCVACRDHFPVGEDGEFHWSDAPGQKVGT